MTELQVDPAQVRAHADAVGKLSAQLSDVAGGLSGQLGGNSLGSFVQFLTAGLSDAMGQTADAVSLASSVLGNVQSGLRRTADHYQDIDAQHAAQMRKEDV